MKMSGVFKWLIVVIPAVCPQAKGKRMSTKNAEGAGCPRRWRA
jgi:hypothetical protein